MKKLIDKFADSPLWFHFVVYVAIIFPVIMLAFYLITAKVFDSTINDKILKAQITLSAFLSLIFGLAGMATDWNGRRNDRYFTKLREFNAKARAAKTAIELHELKNDLTLFYQKHSNGHPHAQSVARDIYTMIETRIEFEFGVKQ